MPLATSDAAFLYFRRGMPDQMVISIIKPTGATDEQATQSASIAATFADKNLLLSGWDVGADRYLVAGERYFFTLFTISRIFAFIRAAS